MAKKKNAAKKKAAEDKQLPARQQTAVTNTVIDDDLLIGDAGAGTDGLRPDDMAIPMLSIVQSNSPQLTPGHSKYIENAETGDIVHSVNAESLGDEIVVIPCAFERVFIEWKPRDSGGGFVAIYDRDDPVINTTKRDGGKDVLPNGNLLVNTAQHYCLLLHEDGSFERVVIPMSSTQLKKSRKWNSLMTSRTVDVKGRAVVPASFYFTYLLGTAAEHNEKGNWYGWTITPSDPVPSRDIYQTAKEFSETVLAGKARAAMDEDTVGDHAEAAEGDAPF